MNAEKFLGANAMQQVKTRKFGGKTYIFFANRQINCVSHEVEYYMTCITPENSFGCYDCVFRARPGNDAEAVYTMYRYLQPWIRREIAKEFTKIENSIR